VDLQDWQGGDDPIDVSHVSCQFSDGGNEIIVFGQNPLNIV